MCNTTEKKLHCSGHRCNFFSVVLHMSGYHLYLRCCSYFEQKCLNSIKKVYQHAGTFYDQQNLKDLLNAPMVSNPEGVTDDSSNVPMTSTPAKKTKRKGHSKLNEQIKRNMYSWITSHPQVFQSPISHDCLKVLFDDQTETQLFPNVLFQVSVIELHNRLVSDTNDGGIKDDRDEDYNIIISDSTL